MPKMTNNRAKRSCTFAQWRKRRSKFASSLLQGTSIGKIIGSGFSNPVLSQNSGFPNLVYFPFIGYHKSGNNNTIRILISGILFLIRIC